MSPKPPPLPSLDAIGKALREPQLPLAVHVGRENTLVRGFTLAPGTKHPLPPRPDAKAPPPSLEPLGDATLESPPPPVVQRGEPPERRQERHAPQTFAPPSFESPARQAEAERVIRRQGDRVEPAAESVPATRSDPPPSLRASVKGIRAWLAGNAKIITWLLGIGTAGGGATALRDQIVQALGLVTQADVAPLRAELQAARATLETIQRERSYEARELHRDLDRLRAEGERRDNSQDGQIERIRRRAVEPEAMTVTPR
jgi:hypothetical protein